MQGKICLITGANAGIGKATALGLAKLGAMVVMVARDKERGEAALAQIKHQSGSQAVHLLLADLSSQAQVRRLAADFNAQFSALHVLINNAGIIPQRRTETVDGLEMQLAVNHLAYFLLTNLLLDKLKTSSPSRIINVSSMVHQGGKVNFDDLQSLHSYRPADVYANTKLMNVLFTYELARRLQGSNITANSLHPGVIPTKLQSDYFGGSGKSSFSDEAAQPGAETSIYLASSTEVEGVSGNYFARKNIVSAFPDDATLTRRLWDVSAELVGL